LKFPYENRVAPVMETKSRTVSWPFHIDLLTATNRDSLRWRTFGKADVDIVVDAWKASDISDFDAMFVIWVQA
jgi:hypothetical protein